METHPAAALPARLTKAERDERRRAEIVEAARGCVLRHGFHASPMTEIARAAGMSMGQVYRYFASKDAIIHAIVDDIIQRRLARMTGNPESGCTPERLASRTPDLDGRHLDDGVLMLEVTAEATRNPEIAALLRAADRRSQEEAARKMLRRRAGLSPAEADARAEVMAVLIEGTLYRRMTELRADPAALRDVYRRVLAVLDAPPGVDGESGAHTRA